jgi:hypothetical protein
MVLGGVDEAFYLANYVPRRVIHRLLKRPVPPTKPEAVTQMGALILADISGFTPLTERLSLDAEGAETLTQVSLFFFFFLRFSDFIDCCYQYFFFFIFFSFLSSRDFVNKQLLKNRFLTTISGL